MKKLMFVAAVAAAMTGLADVTSANVVGYANRSWAQGAKNKMVCSQFQTIGKAADEMTLKDLVPGGEWLVFEDKVKVFKDDATVKFNAVYVDEETAKSLREDEDMPWVTAGWYNPDDEELRTNLKDEPLPLGGTVMAFAATEGSFLTSAGEVVESETGKITFEWEVGSKNKMIGNCTPIDLTLGDFVPGGEWLVFEDKVKVFKDDATVKFNAVYVDEETAKSLREDEDMPWVTAGWYNPDDEELRTNLNDEPMPAGCGVMGFAATAGATIEIPSAL